MSRRKPEDRCEACRLRRECCLCAEIAVCRAAIGAERAARGSIAPRVVILMHHREVNLSTNTGRLAALAVPGCEVRVRGLPHAPTDLHGVLDENRQSVLLYPSAHAPELTPELAAHWKKPLTFVVPDGNWRQASKVATREPLLAAVPHVRLAPGAPTRYRLRHEPKVGGLATFEAIARTLGAVEGASLQERLEELFLEMVRRTLATRGINA